MALISQDKSFENVSVDRKLCSNDGTMFVAACINKANKLVTNAGCADFIEPVFQLLKKNQSKFINVVLAGRFSTGKSSMVNQLVEKRILPVTIIPFPISAVIKPVNDSESEGFIVQTDSAFSEKKSLSDLSEFLKNSKMVDPNIEICVISSWLFVNKIQLLERKSFELSEEDQDALVNYNILHDADIVILTIDANAPLSRIENSFLEECIRRKIPCIISITKIDQISSETDLHDLIEYIKQNANVRLNNIQLCPVCLKPGHAAGLDEVKRSVEAIINNTDFNFLRNFQTVNCLIDCLNNLVLFANNAHAIQNDVDQKQEIEILKRRQQMDEQNLQWKQIEQSMEQRRLKLDEYIREYLKKYRNNILDNLMYDLERTNDVKTWWERDLPFRLQREFSNLSNQISAALITQITNDIKWLQMELVNKINYHINSFSAPSINIETTSPHNNEVDLSNTYSMNVFSKYISAATTIVVTTLISSVGVAGVAVATSLGTQQISNYIVRKRTEKDRLTARAALEKIIDQVEMKCAISISSKLRESYKQVVLELKNNQHLWQQNQLQSLMVLKRKEEGSISIDWNTIINDAKSLASEIITTHQI
jgi:GTP-binding protein EngB required for normal cell division